MKSIGLFSFLLFLWIGCSEDHQASDQLSNTSSAEIPVLNDSDFLDQVMTGERGVDFQLLQVQRTEDSVLLEVGFSGCDSDHEFNLLVAGFDDDGDFGMVLIHKGPSQACEAYFTKKLSVGLDQIFLDSKGEEFTLKLLTAYDQDEYVLPYGFPGLIQGEEIEVIGKETVCQPGPDGLLFEVTAPQGLTPKYDRLSFLPMQYSEDMVIERGKEYKVSIRVLPWSVLAQYATCKMYEGEFMPVKVESLRAL